MRVPDLLREMMKVFAQRMMGAEVEELRGAAHREVSPGTGELP
jgi:transposase-like protein